MWVIIRPEAFYIRRLLPCHSQPPVAPNEIYMSSESNFIRFNHFTPRRYFLTPTLAGKLFMLSRVFLKTNTFKCLFFSRRTTHVEESLSGLHSLMPLLDFWISDFSDYGPKKCDRGLCHRHGRPIMFINLGTMDEHRRVPALTLVLSLPGLIMWYLLATN